jgi:hypothetical protein
VRNLVALTAAVVLAPVVWFSGDLMLRATYSIACVVAVVLVVRSRRHPESHSVAYTRALRESSALHVRLRHVRVAAVHTGDRGTVVTVTWRAASTTLLDADGRTRATMARNVLTNAYTLSILVSDDIVAQLLAREPALGTLAVYGTTDLAEHPDGNLLDHGVVIDQYDVDFPCWSGSLPMSALRADRDV